ncbi:diuretic hormone receptor-like isoform X2 [Aethina tumida]|uniref:diuretic hormone receptor-like isoform X2 n=1 Tax=Aethina tumida TaxID=116153 RepID=UPI0021482AD3|nr:diuretic hormone receptor-like isoform X2 [Aethina tumida]
MDGTNWLQEDGHPDHDVNYSNGLPSHGDPNGDDLVHNVTLDNPVNITYCKELFFEQISYFNATFGNDYCKTVTDQLVCWPPTQPNTTATVKCFSYLGGLRYDDTQNATRECYPNGTWAKTVYDNCVELKPYEDDNEIQTNIYFIGYSISIVTLSIAIGIFTYFKELRCLRNKIHMNLMWSYILFYSVWIIILFLIKMGVMHQFRCIYLITILNYFHISTFFWMFVEGLYLYILVVETLTRENFKLRIYVCIGWGSPLLLVIVWVITETMTQPAEEICRFGSDTDWIFNTPIAVVLVLNLMFLMAIMWVLITKLRSANTVETQQYHKAAKALLVLMPLLGITYIITIYCPPNSEWTIPITRIRCVLLSTQGFTVALFYCFLNTEVQNTVRHHLENWKTSRSLGPSRNRSGSRSKDWSPRSRTESIRVTEWTVVPTEEVPQSDGNNVGHSTSNGGCPR